LDSWKLEDGEFKSRLLIGSALYPSQNYAGGDKRVRFRRL